MKDYPPITITQLEALLLSAEHWLENWEHVRDGREDLYTFGTNHCACCLQWYKYHCDGCPIEAYTGTGDCRETPYQLEDLEFIEDATLENVEEEYVFLIDLALNSRIEEEKRKRSH